MSGLVTWVPVPLDLTMLRVAEQILVRTDHSFEKACSGHQVRETGAIHNRELFAVS